MAPSNEATRPLLHIRKGEEASPTLSASPIQHQGQHQGQGLAGAARARVPPLEAGDVFVPGVASSNKRSKSKRAGLGDVHTATRQRIKRGPDRARGRANECRLESEEGGESEDGAAFLLTHPKGQQIKKGGQISRTEVLSNLTLQIILYFNVVFLPLYFTAYMVLLEAKYAYIRVSMRFLPIALGGVLFLVEPLRMYLAIAGNLQEKIPLFAGFWLLTGFMELPILVYLLTDHGLQQMPFELILHAIFGTFLLVELALGYRLIRRIVRVQASKFHLKDVSSELELANLKEAGKEICWVPLSKINYDL